jgi:hypothetical protein
MTTLTVVLLILIALMIAPTWVFLRERAARKQRGILRPWPIRKISVEQLDPVFARGALGPMLQTEVHHIGGTDLHRIVGATSDAEAWILSVLAKRAHLMFEFGTATGRTAYLWARNSPADARVVTMTLPPEGAHQYERATGDAESDVRNALGESRFSTFYYSGTDVERKVTQLFGDSKTLDETPWVGKCDLVFVDGSHARSHVESDSRKALRMVRPGGLVLWHDYRGRRIPGVFEVLNALARERPLVHVQGTALVAYRAPG